MGDEQEILVACSIFYFFSLVYNCPQFFFKVVLFPFFNIFTPKREGLDVIQLLQNCY